MCIGNTNASKVSNRLKQEFLSNHTDPSIPNDGHFGKMKYHAGNILGIKPDAQLYIHPSHPCVCTAMHATMKQGNLCGKVMVQHAVMWHRNVLDGRTQ